MRHWASAMVATVVLGLSAPSSAQDEPPPEELSEAERVALARDQFEQGVRFARSSRWQDAADRFGRALELKETPQIRYNLAESLVNLGRLVEATEHLTILADADDTPESVRQSVNELRSNVRDRVGELTIEVEGQRPGVRVTLDGRDVPMAVLGVAQPSDPGRHVVRLIVGDDEVTATEEALVPAGGAASVRLVVPSLGSLGTHASGNDDRSSATEGDGGSLWWLWTTLALAAAAGGAVAAYFILTAEPDATPGDFEPTVLEFD